MAENLNNLSMNITSPRNIAATARKIRGTGTAARTLLLREVRQISDCQGPEEFTNWEKDAGSIPEPIRRRLTDIISTDLRSASPLPIQLKVGDNVDDTHELIVKLFAHNSYIYIGLLMLCPNPELK